MGAEQLRTLAMQLRPFLVEILKEEGMVIMRAEDHVQLQEAKLSALQKKLLRKKALTLKEIVDAELLPAVKSKTALVRLYNDGKTFKKDETYIDGKGRRMIMVSAIKRLTYAD